MTLSLSSFASWYDPLFEAATDERVQQARARLTTPAIHLLLEHVRDLTRGGKRVRPLMCAIGASVHSIPPIDLLPLFHSLEWIHTFCLVHDDIMDGALMRRHTKTAEHVARDLYAPLPPERQMRIAQGQAILVGDLIFSWALTQSRLCTSPNTISTLHTLLEEVVLGQMLDLHLTTTPQTSLPELETKNRLKTASYTFVHPLLLGLGLRDVSPELTEPLTRFATTLGLAFQLQDDLLDLQASTAQTGKTSFHDMQEGQQTPITFALASHADTTIRTRFQALFGRALNDQEQNELKDLLQSSGVLNEAKQEVNTLFERATRELASCPIPSATRLALEDLLATLMIRTH